MNPKTLQLLNLIRLILKWKWTFGIKYVFVQSFTKWWQAISYFIIERNTVRIRFWVCKDGENEAGVQGCRFYEGSLRIFWFGMWKVFGETDCSTLRCGSCPVTLDINTILPSMFIICHAFYRGNINL